MLQLKNNARTLYEVLLQKKYLLLLISGSIIFFLFEIFLTQYSVLLFFFTSGTFSWQTKLNIALDAVKFYFTLIPFDQQFIFLLIALLVGLNLATTTYYIKKKVGRLRGGSGLLGIIISILGVGCASCGAVLLSSLLGFTLTIQILAVLPLHGKEFSIAALLLLLSSLYFTTKKIAYPSTCALPTYIKKHTQD